MITNRLDNQESLALINGAKINQVFIDIDYTVFNFDIGNEKGNEELNNYYPKLGDEVNKIFNLVLRAKRDLDKLSKEEQTEYKKTIEEMDKIQFKIVPKYGHKYWSRETMIMLAAKKMGLSLKAKEVLKLRKIYWKAVADAWQVYEDAILFLEKIKEEKIKIIWVTGSDSILKVKQVWGKISLIYGPRYSRKEKSKRLKKLLKQYPGKLVIGDPTDKPELWKKLFKRIDIKKTLVVGDSYDTDLEPAEKLGMETILIKRN